MKWELINNHKEPVQEYHLMENDFCKVILKYNLQQKSARISCANQHRLFFIQNAGVLTGRYTFTNEYGLEIGNITHDKRYNNGGTVCIESKKYHYEISNSPSAELTIYDSNSQRPLVTSGLDVSDNISIILAHCWYLFLPVIKEHVLEYAA
jgi:hypothetical protein